MSLSLYFLPVANRAFKDLEFEIRNKFVSSLIQEGTFTTVSDKLTFYIRDREQDGDVVGLLINDSRDPQRPVTILAERAAFVDTPAGARIIMVNGDRQQFDPRTKKLSVLTFSRYTLDLGALQDAPVIRFREAPERFLGELLFPPPGLNPLLRQSFVIEANQRILIPLSVFSFALIPLAFLLPGDFDRRGQLRRVMLAVGAAFVFELIGFGINDLAARFTALIPLSYVIVMLPAVLSVGILLQGRTKPGFRRSTLAVAPAR
jgi:lipopolysaccharide export system permease protein